MFDQFKSILLYLGLFGISYVLFCTSERKLVARDCGTYVLAKGQHINTAFPYLCSGVAIVLLSLIAGLRGDSVGVDTDLYPYSFMNAALSYEQFIDFWADPYVVPSDEPLHAVLVWLCSRLSSSNILLLFSYQLLTVLPVFVSLCQLRDRVDVSVGMAVYMFFFYNNSLNLMRQSVACAFLLLAFATYLKCERIKPITVACVLVAMLFHRSGIYGFALLLLTFCVARVKKAPLKLCFYAVIVLMPIGVFSVADYLVSAGIADSHVERYLQIFSSNQYKDTYYYLNPIGSYSLVYLCVYSWLVFLPTVLQKTGLACSNANEYSAKLLRYSKTMNITGYLIYLALLFGLQTNYGSRFSLYFDFFLIISLGIVSKGHDRALEKSVVLFSLVAIWFVWIILLGWSGSGVYLFFFE